MNTLENKAKFFAQYYKQYVLRLGGKTKAVYPVSNLMDNTVEVGYLELKPLSNISDEDAIEVCFLNWEIFRNSGKEIKVVREFNEVKVFIHDGNKVLHTHSITECNNGVFATDYLRSKGCALPYNGITVKQQIEWKWIKLKNNK